MYRKQQPKKWIQHARAHMKKGALRRELHIKKGETIPVSLLKEIVEAPLGTKVQGHTVTAKLKQRANFALNVR
jgi:hypothetical protein